MFLILFGFVLGFLTHMGWLHCFKRSTFVTTSYTTNSGRTATYVNYSFPRHGGGMMNWLFSKTKTVIAKRKQLKGEKK